MNDLLDMIGAFAGTAVYALIVGVLVGYSSMTRRMKLMMVAGALVWFVLMVLFAALGWFAPGAVRGFPATVIAFVALLALVFGAWYRRSEFRDGLRSVPFSALIGLNIARLGGIAFLLLAAEGRLSAPFAPIAGAGDMLVAALAIPLAVLATRRDVTGAIAAWNALGALDLLLAVTLAFLSAPATPFRVFAEGPGTLALTDLPWIVAPTMLVPLYFLIHFTIAAKLRERRSTADLAPMPS
jgi:hypothetical protein